MCSTVAFFKKGIHPTMVKSRNDFCYHFRCKYPPPRSSEFTENDHGLFEQDDNASYTYRVIQLGVACNLVG